MATPSSYTTITIDGNKFYAISTQVGVSTIHDHTGMPVMGAQAWSIAVTVDIHDTENMSFAALSALFGLAHQLTKDKLKTSRSNTGLMRISRTQSAFTAFAAGSQASLQAAVQMVITSWISRFKLLWMQGST